MKISTNSRYALRFLTRLANAEGRMTTMSIAHAEGISEKMLERIAAKLGREGFIRSIKGIGGGYELARPSEEITVSQVLQTMETPYLPLHCIEEHEDCRMA
ncbi:MAG: Rrf2 family transcriptional regulator, partial [Oscillospiraceae bacterium]